MVLLAFYNGTGTVADRIIRWVTGSEFSHVEMVDAADSVMEGGTLTAAAWSSSYRDGGVRCRTICFDPNHWVIIPVRWAPDNALAAIKSQSGKKYDFSGLIGSQILNLRRQRRDRWFCSELCAHALGLSLPQEYSPGTLWHRTLEMNAAYQLGMRRGGTARGSGAVVM